MTSPDQSSNFNFLAEHDSLLVELAQAAERIFSSDPNTSLIKLRQLGEALAQHLASIVGVEFSEHNGAKQFDNALNGQLASVMDELTKAVWVANASARV